MTIEIRSLRPEDMDESLRLSQFAFQYEMTPEELEKRKQILNPSWTWAWFEAGQMAAKASFLPLRVFIGARPLPMGGVAGVATWPEHRRSGKVDSLLRRGLHVMRERGETVSMLAPFSFPFYAKYGWTMLTERKHYTFEAAHIAQLHSFAVPEGGQIRRVNAEAEWDLLNSIYRQYAEGYTGMLERDRFWWHSFCLPQKKGQAAVYVAPDGTPRGYLLYKVWESALTVHEAVWLDPAARGALLKFLANHDSMVKSIALTLPASDRLPFLLTNPTVKLEVKPYFMIRLVDVEGFAATAGLTVSAPLDVAVALSDAHAPWNEGLFVLRAGPDGLLAVARAEGREPDLRCDIAAFTALLTGTERPESLYENGRLIGSREAAARLEAALPHRNTYLADFF